MRKVIGVLVPVFLLILGIGFIVFWEFSLKDKIDTVPVLVAAENIEFKEEFTEKNLKIVQVKKDNVVDGALQGYKTVQEAAYVLGYYSAIDIKKGTQIYQELIDLYDLVPNDKAGEFIAPIPQSWIFSVPGSIRRSYIADIYIIDPELQTKQPSGNATVTTVKAKDTDNDGNKEVQIISEQAGDSTHSQQEQDDFITEQMKQGKEPILKSVRISAAKDGTNREVRKVEEEDKATEHDATGVVSSIEIITNQEDLNKLREFTDKGYKVYITYNFERGDEK